MVIFDYRAVKLMNKGDLGASPREVEKKLEEAFQLAQLWNCVLLLDEADIFLAQRSEDDIERNALVSGRSHACLVSLITNMTVSFPPGSRVLRRHPIPHHKQSRCI